MREQTDVEVYALRKEVRALAVRFSIMEQFFKLEFPKYFAGDTALGIATNGEKFGDETLPDIHPIDLRTPEEIERGECVHIADLVAMEG